MDSKRWITAEGEFCSERPPCLSLQITDDCDNICKLYKKDLKPVFNGPTKEFRLRRCAECLMEVPA